MGAPMRTTCGKGVLVWIQARVGNKENVHNVQFNLRQASLQGEYCPNQSKHAKRPEIQFLGHIGSTM